MELHFQCSSRSRTGRAETACHPTSWHLAPPLTEPWRSRAPETLTLRAKGPFYVRPRPGKFDLLCECAFAFSSLLGLRGWQILSCPFFHPGNSFVRGRRSRGSNSTSQVSKRGSGGLSPGFWSKLFWVSESSDWSSAALPTVGGIRWAKPQKEGETGGTVSGHRLSLWVPCVPRSVPLVALWKMDD